MVISEIEGLDFSTVIGKLQFHDSWLKDFHAAPEDARLVVEYYNFEDTDQNPTAPWYELHFSFGKILHLEFALPTSKIADLEIGSVEYNTHFNETQSFHSLEEIERNLTTGSGQNGNYLSVHLHLITRDDLGFGTYGFIKILAINASIEACIEKARDEY